MAKGYEQALTGIAPAARTVKRPSLLSRIRAALRVWDRAERQRWQDHFDDRGGGI